MIEVSHLSKSYGSRPAVQDLSFTVPDGQIYGLLGPNGAGKSTIMNILTGYLAPTEGEVKVAGFRLPEQAQQAKACVGYLPEQPPLYPEMTVQEYLDFVAELKGVKHAQRKQQVLAAARRTGLEEVLPRVIRSLSKGYRQRVGIAQALLGSPQLIILDEPTVGLDIQARRGLWDLLRKLNDDGMTIFLTTHYIEEAESLCNRVSFIEKGKIIAEGTPEELAHRIGAATVEYFGPDHKTQYKYFQTRAEADGFAKTLDETYTVTVRRTNLEDAFVEMTGNKIGDNGFMLGQSGKGGSGMKKMGGM